MVISDVDGVKISRLYSMPEPLQSLVVGGWKCDQFHGSFSAIRSFYTTFPCGWAGNSSAPPTNCLLINANDVIGDNLWLWRADHGAGCAMDAESCQMV